MKKYIPVLRRTALFAGLDDSQIEAMTACLRLEACAYRKGETVYHSGQFIRVIGILASGCLLIQRDDYWGNRSVVNRLGVGEVFGEAFALQDSEAFFHDVIALEDSIVLALDPRYLFTSGSGSDALSMRLIENLLRSVSAKSRTLAQKIDCMARRTTREKLIAYLSAQSQRTGSARFDIPFDRQQMADYLGVDRSAMCTELGKMRDEGMLTFHKRTFTLLKMEK